MNPPINQYESTLSSVLILSEDEQLDRIELTDVASNSVFWENPP
ncbi:unnamed protein product, partial [Rotaria magnacalcarata]